MKCSHTIAQRLFDARVRLSSIDDRGALLMMPQYLQSWVAAQWLSELNWDVEIVVSGTEVKTLGAQQAWINAAFEDIQRSDFADEVDQALWLIQQQHAKERAA
jgi:hypothetical protein